MHLNIDKLKQFGLTMNEIQIALLIMDARTEKEMAIILCRSRQAIAKRKETLIRKLGIKTKVNHKTSGQIILKLAEIGMEKSKP